MIEHSLEAETDRSSARGDSRFKWKYNALRHAYGSYRTALIQNVPQVALEMGNSVHMVKRHYLEAKTFEEGLCWFRITWPLPKKQKSKDPFVRWVAAA